MQYVKAPIRAVDFVKIDTYKTWLQGSIGKTWVVGHTRLWSRGPPEFNENNHPVMLPGQEKKALIVHNGAFNAPAYDKDRNKSDTHIPLWITENDDINSKETMLAALEKIYTVSSGSFVYVMGTPDILGFSRSFTRPLVFYSKGKNVAFASTDEILGHKSTHEMTTSQSMVFSKITKKWTKVEYTAPTTTAIVEYAPQTSAEIENGQVKGSSIPNLVTHGHTVVTVDSPDGLRNRLDELTELEEFNCFTCGEILFWECITKVENERLFYKCPNAKCKNHSNEGWRSLKSLRIKYNKLPEKISLPKGNKTEKKDPKSWFEEDDVPCIDRAFIKLDGFTNEGYCLDKERYVNKTDVCTKCEKGSVQNESRNKSYA